ncbi:ABC transporter ATP-binding protein [Dermatophilus congolensis]|uniref:ABC transporter ATP-binding protein n=1 Tax=Dermatophilus congolensis TaxID=1863 RepID=UPI001AAE790C|nr:ABC transporter ATP-binding protein [Dermatophilus congolensis]MBO3142607.1 ABC transporter ATP-binding protein [Dermatophilus congolensis]MBO3151596.1 ABC transporter ATP-binding protein [Dermatophilus congolensis]MBO3161402.1 ABC transporter ATP-binding protein [Dermatophilus congolensis]MBO3162881.1 ABC transporter ATP-binding protein [Dermatophilus congolensis]MBO3176434.1 ABC transporter ATP-binding protein [Dermatophilus congolensis]
MRANTTAAGELRSIRKTYGSVIAVDDLSLHVTPGEILTLVGPNGAGKTTTMEILAGLRSPDCGQALVHGNIPATSFKARLHVGIQQQKSRLPTGLKVREVIRSTEALYRDPGSVATIVDRLGLSPYRNCPVEELAGQWRRRLAVALACIGRPSLLIFDEPTSGLASEDCSDMWQFFCELRDRGAAIVTSAADFSEAEAFADRGVVLSHGRVVAEGAAPDIFAALCA